MPPRRWRASRPHPGSGSARSPPSSRSGGCEPDGATRVRSTFSTRRSDLARPGGHLQRLGHAHAARAEAAWLAGDTDRTVEEAQAVYALALEKRHLWFAGELAYWQWKAGELEEAPEWIAEPYRLQLDGAAREAAEAWRARGCPYEGARALADSGADADLHEALAELERRRARTLRA